MAIGESNPSKDIPALVPGRDIVAANQSQPAIDDLTRKLYQDSLPATFQVIALAQGTSRVFAGSGYLANANHEGLTNAHVVLGRDELFVITADGLKHQAKIVDMDEVKDVAKIEVQNLSASESHFLALSSNPLQRSERTWALGHPLGSDKLYISPGKFLNERSDLSIMMDAAHAQGITATEAQILKLAAVNLPAPMAKDIDDRLKEPLDGSDAHIEPGNSGGPFVNQQDKVTGLVSQGVEDGTANMVPLKTLRAFSDEKVHKFNFEYQQKSDASLWMTNWSEHPLHNIKSGAPDAIWGGVGVRTAISGSFKSAGAAFGVIAVENLVKDYDEYKVSASPLLRAEAGIKVVGDSIALLGSAAMMVPKVRLAGKLALGAGAAVHTVANFLPSHLMLTKTTRVEGPDRPPTPFDD